MAACGDESSCRDAEIDRRHGESPRPVEHHSLAVEHDVIVGSDVDVATPRAVLLAVGLGRDLAVGTDYHVTMRVLG